MNTNFQSGQKTLKQRLDSISQIAKGKSDAELLSRVGAVNGLYSAYELCPSEPLMHAIALALAEITEMLLSSQAKALISPKATSGSGRDIFKSFEDYLINDRKSDSVAKVYMRAVKRLLKNNGEDTSDSLFNHISALNKILSAPRLDLNNEQTLGEIADLVKAIIFEKETDVREIEKNKRDHGTTLCALKRFYSFILQL